MTARQIYFAVTGKKLPRRSPRKRSKRGPYRCYRYRGWIRTLPSAVSGVHGCEAAHTGTDGGMALKASDLTCIPLTPAEHREYHQIGKTAFEERHGISCEAIVKRLNDIWFRYSQEVK